MVALTAVGAFVKIPLPYVPLTLQVAFVGLSGIFLGKKWGAFSQAVYVAVGLIGVPVFAQGGGPGYVLQPTFGYLVGFVGGAYLTGILLEGKPWQYRNLLLALLAGFIPIYSLGVLYLYISINFLLGKALSLATALKIGLLVPLPGDILAACLAAWVAFRIGKLRLTKNGLATPGFHH
jgi:biotin transport system substrate-specific component